MSIKEALPVTKETNKLLADLIIDSIQDIKGKEIVKMDLRKLDNSPTDCFIVCEGDSSTQIRAISHNIYRRVKEEMGLLPNHIEGDKDAHWILVDYFDLVVHIFYPESRSFYGLENLWSDADIESIEEI